MEASVLVIYTGGTIGMLLGSRGFVPEPHFLTETLRSQARFHDPLQESLFSNAASVERFRSWSSNTSSRSSPEPTRNISTMRVRSWRPIPQHPHSKGSTSLFLHNAEVKDASGVYEADLPCLLTPSSTVPGGIGSKSIRYVVLEWDPLLDSSNIEIDDWIRIASEIELNYHAFDAFVVLHGTDTMAYTSSALSFMLEDLGKTVILTGAQIPLSQLRNDATDNLMGALLIAGHYIIPECCLYFNHTLYRGNRVSKVSSYDLNAFDSPNFPPLVNVGIDIVVNWNEVLRQTSLRKFHVHKVGQLRGPNAIYRLSLRIVTLRMFPGIPASAIKAFCTPPVRGVILETFGAGNSPSRPDLLAVLQEACDNGVVVVAISQCTKGSVSAAYETGQALMNVGVVPGYDMSPECALTKLSYLLSKPDLTIRDVRQLMGTPLRGELTKPAGTTSGHPVVGQNFEHVQSVLSHLTRLSQPKSAHGPPIVLSQAPLEGEAQSLAASWSFTAAEAVSTEDALYPFLIHLAASKNDLEGLQFCIDSNDNATGSQSPVESNRQLGDVAAGVVNCLDGSGRSPLHSAALKGHSEAVNLLLQSGALVHQRDVLGHTALYYACRGSHEAVVDLLVSAGATLSGADIEYADLAYMLTQRSGDANASTVWVKAGVSRLSSGVHMII
ncbi:L-asparaginase [Fistulina hepatica ATCC 64428]|nr:L-asparaginase [Fistulina hepatica ATCC 64428]